MRLLFIGDIVGRPGRRAVAALMPELKRQYRPDVIVANGENAAGGFGLTMGAAEELLSCGIELITMGNHTWDNKEIFTVLTEHSEVIRPANYPPGAPGNGFGIIRVGGGGTSGAKIAVINLNGRVFMDQADDPFRAFDEIYDEIRASVSAVFVDFHAEATSEKVAFGWFADGRATGVFGTHTHVPTADERILPMGTAYITDVGMTGPLNSVLGIDTSIIIRRFRSQLPERFEIAKGPVSLNSIIVDFDELTGKALAIERVSVIFEN
ncbi:MAG: TIGR00282 family metallophosphoesterase [Bacillota bacterium]|jgi:metallophosphoesterase (TIGR00282 family)